MVSCLRIILTTESFGATELTLVFFKMSMNCFVLMKQNFDLFFFQHFFQNGLVELDNYQILPYPHVFKCGLQNVKFV